MKCTSFTVYVHVFGWFGIGSFLEWKVRKWSEGTEVFLVALPHRRSKITNTDYSHLTIQQQQQNKWNILENNSTDYFVTLQEIFLQLKRAKQLPAGFLYYLSWSVSFHPFCFYLFFSPFFAFMYDILNLIQIMVKFFLVSLILNHISFCIFIS